jgi:hypothetical protein
MKFIQSPWQRRYSATHSVVWSSFITSREPKTEHAVQQYMYSSVVIWVSVVTGTRINLAVTNLLSEALSRECMFALLCKSRSNGPTVTGQRSAKRCPALDHSGFQASCHNINTAVEHIVNISIFDPTNTFSSD